MINRFAVFCTQINKLSHHIQRIKNHEMKEFNLKGIHCMCIFQLHHNDQQLTLTQLAANCNEDKAAISRVVNQLTVDGYINEQPANKYRVCLTLTEKGHQVAEKIDELAVAAVDAIGKDLSNEEREIFYKALDSISNNITTYLND